MCKHNTSNDMFSRCKVCRKWQQGKVTRLLSSPTQSSWTRRRSSPTKGFPWTPSTMTLHSRVCFVKLTEYIAILSVSLSSSSVSDRTVRPVGDRTVRPTEQSSQEAQVRTLLDNQKEQILAECQAKLTDTNFKPLTTEEVYLKWVKLLNLNEKNFTALELKKFNDEINSSFKDSDCSKIWNYVKRTEKVSQKWQSYRSFRVPPSTLLQDED